LAKRWPRQYNYARFTHFPPHLIYVNALQMHQIPALHGDYFYPTAHLCIIS